MKKCGCNARIQKETLVCGIRISKLIDLWLKQFVQVALFYLQATDFHLAMSTFNL